MADAYIIEISGYTAGIVAREHQREAFAFFASHPRFHPLEGRRFASPSSATRAAHALLGTSRRPKKPARPAASPFQEATL